jgi:hypothetical protein
MFLEIFGKFFKVSSPKLKLTSIVKPLLIEYNGKKVKANKLIVHSELPLGIDSAWDNVKSPALLEFVAKGMIKFKCVDGDFPKQWEIGQTYRFKTLVFRIILFGGIHHLFVEKIDNSNYMLSTKEWDSGVKVWNHDIKMKKLGDGNIYYEDSITIYAGIMTGFITSFAKQFYKYRQQRWRIVAEKNLKFGD